MMINSPFAIIHIPHSSTQIPAVERKSIVLTDDQLHEELVTITDMFTDELFVSRNGHAGEIIFPVSRLVVDPERFLDDKLEPMSVKGMGVVYTKTSRGTPLRAGLTPAQKTSLIDKYYKPHHGQFSQYTADTLDKNNYCLIMDCHSFPSVPLPFEPDQSPDRPEICIGADEFHTPEWLQKLLLTLFNSSGFTTAINRPFSGSIVPLKYYQINSRVHSIMIEINRKLYMDETTGERNSTYNELKAKLHSIISAFLVKIYKTLPGAVESS
jgi:N-formylglutamate deformylase